MKNCGLRFAVTSGGAVVHRVQIPGSSQRAGVDLCLWLTDLKLPVEVTSLDIEQVYQAGGQPNTGLSAMILKLKEQYLKVCINVHMMKYGESTILIFQD